MKDTIVAVATSTASKAGVNIVRLSGNTAKEIVDGIFSTNQSKTKKWSRI